MASAILIWVAEVTARTGLRCQSTGRLVLTAKRPKSSKYPKTLATLGDHIKKRRLDLGLHQVDVAEILGVTESTVTNWEKNRTNPTLRPMPEIIQFLGYVPEMESVQTCGEKIVRYRRMHGINQEALARELGVDPATLGRWERDEGEPRCELEERLASFLKKPS
jgi:transcriptional regulator with XRE-family HTH domain